MAFWDFASTNYGYRLAVLQVMGSVGMGLGKSTETKGVREVVRWGRVGYNAGSGGSRTWITVEPQAIP